MTKDHADQVLTNFIMDVEDPANFAVGTENYVKKVLSNAFGEDKASAFIGRIMADLLTAKDGVAQPTYIWRDEVTGLLCKAKLDWDVAWFDRYVLGSPSTVD